MARFRRSLVVIALGAMLASGAGCSLLVHFDGDDSGNAAGDGGATGLDATSGGGNGGGATLDSSSGSANGDDDAKAVSSDDSGSTSTAMDADAVDTGVATVDAACFNGRNAKEADSLESPSMFDVCNCDNAPDVAWSCAPPANAAADAAVTCTLAGGNSKNSAPAGTMYTCEDGAEGLFRPLMYFQCGAAACIPTPGDQIGAVCNPCNMHETGDVCLALPDQVPFAAALIHCADGVMTLGGGCDDSTCCGSCTR